MATTSSEPEVLNSLRQIQQTQTQLLTAIESLAERMDTEQPGPSVNAAASTSLSGELEPNSSHSEQKPELQLEDSVVSGDASSIAIPASSPRSGFTSRIVLT